jgi:hypothetical protein
MSRTTSIGVRVHDALKAFKAAQTPEELEAVDRRCATIKADLKTIYDQTKGPCDAWNLAKTIEHARMQRAEDLNKGRVDHV